MSATAAPEPIHVKAAAAPAGTAKTVTLITGDTVNLVQADGGRTGALIKPGPGRERVAFSTRTVDKHVHVLPADAAPLVASGRLDRRLFDITQLVAFGYDDAATPSLPLIVTGAGRSLSGIAGTRVTRQLESIGGVALAASKVDAAPFWRSLTGGAAARGLAETGGKVWLSGKSRLVDAESNAQIGVPAARAAGYDGKGVTVAVLDSGIDASHPDVKDVLGETKDFTGSPDGVKDGHGHGTHVATTIAGTGAKNAAYAGVAPAATVMVGRVCGTQYCEDSAVIDGMEWAAGKAKVVNLSLGSDGGAEGTDPVAQSLNALTASTGTLFVASAGNSYNSYTVGSPAAADAALAVASVGRSDAVSDFSSKGPRVGDHSVKPDIAAPGERIVAGRAAGTSMGSPVDDFYTAASGTSMASPHVAGVAALLAQARPDWKADKLKAALMSSSAAPEGLEVFHAGAGRVDAARAVSQTVFADGSVSFPYVAWPHTGSAATETVTYHNEGSVPVTLDLALAGGDAFSLASPTVTVPAGGSAKATVALDGSKLPAAGGAVSTHLTATGPGVSVRTAVGAVAEPESYTVEITMLGRDGKPAGAGLFHTLYLYPYERSGVISIDPDIVDGVATARVPKGDYAITADTTTVEADGTTENQTSQVIAKYTVSGDAKLTLDARKGVRTAITVKDRPAATREVLNADWILSVPGLNVGGGLFAGIGDPGQLYVVPTEATPGSTLAYGVSAVLKSPKGAAKPYKYYLTAVAPGNGIPSRPIWTIRTADLAQRHVRFRAPGKPTDAEFARAPLYLPNQFFFFGAWTPVSMPVERTDYLSTAPKWSTTMAFQRPAGQPRTAPTGFVHDLTGTVKTGRPVSEDWNRAVTAPGLALAPNYSAQIVRSEDQLYTYIPMFAPAGVNQGNDIGLQYAFATGDTTLALDGHDPVGSGTPGAAAFAGLPAEDSRYTLTASATRRDLVAWSDLSTSTEATWTFRSAAQAEIEWLPLMYLRTTGALDDLNRARPGLFSLSVDVLRQPGATATTAKTRKVTVEYSTDDGKTWKRAPVVFGSGNAWRAVVVNPRSGFVSLRTTATDSAGDTHSTTVIRAYSIR